MTAATITKINAAIAKHGVAIHKDQSGYFYFYDLGEAFIADKIKTVWSYHLRCMTLEDWVAYVETALACAE